MPDQKLTELSVDTTPSTDDLIYTVNNPTGAPTSRKVAISDFLSSLEIARKPIEQVFTAIQTFFALRLRYTSAPSTGINEVALFIDSADGKLKTRAPSDGEITLVGSGSGGSGNYEIKSASYTAKTGDRLLIDTTAAGWTLTLPSTALPGESIPLACTGSLSTFPLAISSSKNVNGKSGGKIVNNYARTDLIYVSDTAGWIASPDVLVFSTPRLRVSDGDANGVFYFAGTNWGANGSWANPVTLGTVTATATGGTLGGAIANWMDRDINEYISNIVSEAYYEIDLKTKKLQLNRYSLRARNDGIAGADAPRTWKMQGLNGSTWVDLDSRANDTSLNTQLQWANFGVNTTNSYSKFRFQWYGPNGSGRNIMALSEMELYGFLDDL